MYGRSRNQYFRNDDPTPENRTLHEKLTVAQLLKRFPSIYWTKRFILVLKTPPWDNPETGVSSPHPHTLKIRFFFFLVF
jgi:hypothetical protein